MAESCGEYSDGVDSNEDFESPSPSSSSEESAKEDEPDTSSIVGPSGSKWRKNDSQPQSTGEVIEKKQRKNKKKQNDSLNNTEMEELISWIFSFQEAAQVEAEIRPQVAGSPRMKLISEQKANVQLLIAGFCHKFSSLVSECSQLPDKEKRKAAFSAAWMKLLSNFRSGKSSQERLIVEKLLVGQQFNPFTTTRWFSGTRKKCLKHYVLEIRQKKTWLTTRHHTEADFVGGGVFL